jgi:hypothetical protein
MGFAEIVLAQLVGGYDSHPPFIPPHLGTGIPNEGGNGRYFQGRELDAPAPVGFNRNGGRPRFRTSPVLRV